MAKTPAQLDQKALYEAALEGLELQKQRIEEQIAAVRSLLGGKKPAAPAAASVAAAPAAAPAKKKAKKGARKRVLSAEARKRIAEAQKKRWAAFRKDKSS
jgi:uncharacterized protein (DUF1800 family)